MPIRINLKELFPADAQEITIDKINFNFNKLLELGVGEIGLTGLSGIQGAAGPIGGTGSQGIRGVTWIVDAGSPTITTGLLDGDLYLDSNALAVWQWDADTNSWVFLFDISQIVQNYLNASASPFVRGFGSGSPDDQRFIVFGKKDHLPISDDQIGGASSTNDVLFLSNYEESLIPLPNNIPALSGSPDTNDFYSALLNISVDQRNSNPNHRSHLELGVLYDPATPTLTSVAENFKVRYDRINGSKHIGLNYYNRTSFSLDIPDSFSSATRNFSSLFAFESPKYQPNDYAPASSSVDRSLVLIGSRYGLDEEILSATSGDTVADGIVFYTSPAQAGGNIGTAVKYIVPEIPQGADTGYFINTSTTLPLSRNYFMLDTVGTTDAIFLKGTVYQNEGNLIQLGTNEASQTGSCGILVERVSATVPKTYLNSALAQQGNRLYAIFGYASVLVSNVQDNSAYNEISITNPNFPILDRARPYVTIPSSLEFSGISDLAAAGDYLYCVKNVSQNNTGGSSSNKITLQAVKIAEDVDDQLPSRTGYFDPTMPTAANLDCAYRIKLRGNLAVIGTNALPISSTVSNLGGALTAGNTYDGRVTLIDITCPQDLRFVSTVAPTKTSGSTSSTRAAILDMDIVDDFVYALTWEQTPVSASSATVRVKVDVFSIEEADAEPATAITWKTDTYGITNGKFVDNTVNGAAYSSLSKVGAICANKKYIYAAYSVYSPSLSSYFAQIRTYQVKGGIGTPVIPASLTLESLSTLTLTVAGQQISEINKIQQVGNSLYALVNTQADGSYLIKVDVSNVSSPFQVWAKQVGTSSEYCSNFVLNGKHIYIPNSYTTTTVPSGSPNSVLKAFSIAGFYTGAAHIESLRVDDGSVIKNFNVGNNAIINNELNVGGRAEIVGELGVGTRLRLCGGSYITGENGNVNIYTQNQNTVRIKSTGDSFLTLENPGGSYYNHFKMFDGDSSNSANASFTIKSYPSGGGQYIDLFAENGRSLALTANTTASTKVTVNSRLEVYDWVKTRSYHGRAENASVPSGTTAELTPGLHRQALNSNWTSGNWRILQLGNTDNMIFSGTSIYYSFGFNGIGYPNASQNIKVVNFSSEAAPFSTATISSNGCSAEGGSAAAEQFALNYDWVKMNWTRVGQLVTVFFQMERHGGGDWAGSSIDSVYIPIPVITRQYALSLLLANVNLFGSGTLYNSGNFFPVEIKSSNLNKLAAIVSCDNISSHPNGPIRGSFSYNLY